MLKGPKVSLKEAGFEPSVPLETAKFEAGSCRLRSILRQRKTRRERQPKPRGRRVPSAGPTVRILFPPAVSHANHRFLGVWCAVAFVCF